MEQQQQQSMTFKEKVNLFKAFTGIVSLSVIVFIRRRIGFRLLDSGWYVAAAAAVGLLGLFNYNPQDTAPQFMLVYAFGILLFGAIHRAVAWFQFRKGTQPHSYSTGISIFEALPFPRFLRTDWMVNRFWDPVITALVGLMVKVKICEAMGNWLIFAAACLFLHEIFAQAHAVGRDMDIADGLMAANAQSESAKRFEGPKGNDGTNGGVAVPTGLGKDIRANRIGEGRK